MPKNFIHPKWYPHAKVFCDGQFVIKMGSTQPRLNIDVCSDTHPYYNGTLKTIVAEGRIERFQRRYLNDSPE